MSVPTFLWNVRRPAAALDAVGAVWQGSRNIAIVSPEFLILEKNMNTLKAILLRFGVTLAWFFGICLLSYQAVYASNGYQSLKLWGGDVSLNIYLVVGHCGIFAICACLAEFSLLFVSISATMWRTSRRGC